MDVLLLALGVPEKGAGQQGGAGDRQMQALATVAYLLEVKRFEPLQYLLGGGHLLGVGGGTRLEPPLAQRLFLLAEHLEASWQGTCPSVPPLASLMPGRLLCLEIVRHLQYSQMSEDGAKKSRGSQQAGTNVWRMWSAERPAALWSTSGWQGVM